jgi:hypothetical protein
MASISWKPNASGYWTVASNWSGGVLPAAADAVTLTSLVAHSIYVNTNDTVASLTSTNDLLAVKGGTLGVSGTLKLAGGLTQTGGILTLLGASDSIAGPINVNTGSIDIGASTTLTLTGKATFDAVGRSNDGASILGAGTLVTTGTTAIAESGSTWEAVLGGGLTWDNLGTVAQAGTVTAFGTPAATANLAAQPTWTTSGIVNLAGATYDLTSDDASIVNSTLYDQYGRPHTTTSSFLNAGALAKTGGTGISHIYSLLSNTGTIAAAYGTLELDGGGTIGGTLKGSGTVALGGGSFALTPAVAVQAAVLIDGATVTLGGNLTPAGGFGMTGGTLELSGHSLTLASPSLFGGTIDGLGTVTTSGTTATGNFSLGGGAHWVNTGTVNEPGNDRDYAADVNGAGTITNQAGASWNFVDNSGFFYNASNYLDGSFVNAGTFAKTGGTSISHVLATFTSTGVVSAAAGGSLEFDSSGTIGGTISGAGIFAVGDWNGTGAITLAAGATLAVANLLLDGGTITLGGVFSYAGAFSMVTGELELNGNSFAVDHASLNGTVDGAGTFTTSGTTTATYFSIGGGADWVNTGTVYVSSGTISDGDGNGPGTITNAAGASFDLTTDTSTQPSGGTAPGSFVNAGTLAKTGGTGTSNLYFKVTNSGVIAANDESLELDEGGTIGGTISGAGILAFGSYDGLGTYTIASGATISVANLVIDGGTVRLNESLTYGGDLVFATGTLALNGQAFTVKNALLSYGTIDGPGWFVTAGTTDLAPGGSSTFGGAATWINAGTIVQGNYTLFAADQNGAAEIVNEVGAVYDLAGEAEIASTTSIGAFTNGGMFENTGAGSDNSIAAVFTNTGTIDAATGTTDFDDGGTFGGTIIGSGTVGFLSKEVNLGGLGIASGVTLLLGNGSGLSIDLTGVTTIAAAFDAFGVVTELDGTTLSLSGAADFGAINGGAYDSSFDGTGTVATSGATTIADGGPNPELTLGGGAVWSNTATIIDDGVVQLGSYDGAGTITNASTGVFDLATDDAGIVPGITYDIFDNRNPVYGTFSNAGTLAKTAGTATSTIDAVIVNTGTLAADAQGVLAFADGGTLGGRIAAGAILLGGGDFVLNGLTDGSLLFVNSLADQTGTVTLGSGTSAAQLIVDDTYNIDNDSSVVLGATGSSVSVEAHATIAKIGGSATSTIAAAISDNGLILAAAGRLVLSLGVTGTGTAVVDDGTSLEFGSSVANTVTVTLGSSGTLQIDVLASFKAPIAGFIQGDTIDVRGLVATTGTASSAGLLTLNNGTTIVGTLQLVGNHTGDSYGFTGDGTGGTLIGITRSPSSWTGGTSDWATSSGWSAGLPGAGTDAMIAGTATETVSVVAHEYDTVHALTLSDAGAVLAIDGGLTATTTIAATAGTIALAGVVTVGTISVGGGFFTIPTGQNAALTAAAFEGALDLSAYDASLTLSGGPRFSGVGGTGKATLTITGQSSGLYEEGNVTLDDAAIALGNDSGPSTLLAEDTIDSGSLLTLGIDATITQAGSDARLGDSGYDTDGVFLSGAIVAGVTGGLFTVTGNLFENDGRITVSNGDTFAIQSTTFTNAGSLSATGATLDLGSSTVVTNSGVIEAGMGGTLTLAGGISGAGRIKIDAGGTLDVASSVAATETIGFGGAGGTLKIDSPATFKASITGFAVGDTIDISTLAGATITLSGTTLTVKSGATSDTYRINALPAGAVLVTASDGKSGTEVTAYAQAVASGHSPQPVAFGNHHVGDTLTQALSVTNTAAASGYSETLDGSIGSATPGVTASGSFTHLAAGATSTATAVSLASTTPGSESGTARITLNSDGAGVDGRGTTALASQTVTISGAVYAYAAPVLGATAYNAGVVHVGGTITQVLTITDATTDSAFTEGLDATFLTNTGSVTGSGTLSLLGAGATDSQSLVLALNTATSGTISGTATLGLTSDGSGTSGLGSTALPSQTITLRATVDNYAIASLKRASGSGTLTASGSSYTLNLGSVLQGAAAPSADLEVLNSATGLADLLGGSFTVTTASTAITNTGLTAFSDLGAGAADTAPVVRLATTAAGTFSERITIASAGSNASGYSGALAPLTLTVIGIVAQTYTLTTGIDTIAAGAGNNLILATNAALSAGDSINGGGGTNTLKLSGGGTFDLSQPTTLTAVQAVTAQEASGAAAQTVILRNGYTGAITAMSGAAGSGITIIGAADSAAIDLGTGKDTVTVGATTETIKGGGGNNTFNVTAATIGAKITGGAGTNTLAVSGGGTVAMGPSITGVTHVTLSDAGVTGTIFTANTTSGLAIAGGGGTDTITLGAAKQSVAAGTGTTLVKGVMADAGDLVTTAGTTTFELTTGGAGTLNAGDGGIIVTLDAASTLGLGTAAFITVIGAAAGKDTLTAGAADQTLESRGGTDTLVGAASFGDTFLGTAAGFAGDVIKNLGGSDVIDFTDIMAASFKSLAYTGTAASGKLVVTDGTGSGAVTLAGDYTKASFVVGIDAHGGTLISFS